MREGCGLSDSKGIQLVMKVLYTLLSQQGLVCEDTRVRFYLTLPGAVGRDSGILGAAEVLRKWHMLRW